MRTQLLEKLVADFTADSAVMAKAMREMCELDPEAFPAIAADVLGRVDDSPGAQFLLALLLEDADALRILCDTDVFSLEQSVDLIRRAHRGDRRISLKLAKLLAAVRFESAAETKFAERASEVLRQSPDPATAMPVLLQLVQCANPRVRSKAALLIGQINRNARWMERGRGETDARVFANAVESLWGTDAPAARDTFRKASFNGHHRVAANAIVGSYLAGDVFCLPLFFQFSVSPESASRAAAAWAMGRVEDPRFLPRLARMLEDSEPSVRRAAFRAIARVRKKAARVRAAGLLPTHIETTERSGDHHIVCVMVQGVDNLDARHFLIWNGSDLVEEFTLTKVAETTSGLYEARYLAPAFPARQVKVQVYTNDGAGEDTGIETAGLSHNDGRTL